MADIKKGYNIDINKENYYFVKYPYNTTSIKKDKLKNVSFDIKYGTKDKRKNYRPYFNVYVDFKKFKYL